MLTTTIPPALLTRLRRGMVIPAMPLALDARRQLDTRHQKALIRYYIDAGAGGIAVGVHTTQFSIRLPEINLFQPVLSLASQAIDEWSAIRTKPILKIAGVCGRTDQARQEAELARQLGYHASLLSLGNFPADDLEVILQHCRQISTILPLVGFYLQPAVGGRVLPYDFWRRFVDIDQVIAIKVAPFNRYQTLDVVRAVCEAGRAGEIALYTGNDDHILFDLLTQFTFNTPSGLQSTRFVGGLLGHWAFWTGSAVRLLTEVHQLIESGAAVPASLITRAEQITDANAAIFDAANQFAGCIPGIHAVLVRQGLMAGSWCLDPNEVLSPGQAEAIQRVIQSYPDQADDNFVRQHLDEWLAD
jgi:dihydrodipicolinate synthase/N-acetylneuraminate lyase